VIDGQYWETAIAQFAFCADTEEAAIISATAANTKLCRVAPMLPLE
jgi:hypothetical protein